MARDIDEHDSIVCRKLKKIDWSGQEKIRQANRSVREIEQDMYEVAKLRRLPGERDKTKKLYVIDERADAMRLLLISFTTFIGFSAILFALTDSQTWTLSFLIVFLVISLGISIWRGYVDLYFKASEIRKKVKQEGREPISLIEAIRYLLKVFVDTETIESQASAFTIFPDYKECREEVMSYLENIDAAIKDPDNETPHTGKIITALEKRWEIAIKELDDLKKKESEAEEFWHDLYKTLMNAENNLIRMREWRERHLKPEKLGSIDDLEQGLEEAKEEVAEEVIADVESLCEKIYSAQLAYEVVLGEKARNKKDSTEVEPEIEEKQPNRGGGSIV